MLKSRPGEMNENGERFAGGTCFYHHGDWMQCIPTQEDAQGDICLPRPTSVLQRSTEDYYETSGSAEGRTLHYHHLVVAKLGRVVRKSVNTNPGLKVNRSTTFSCLQLFFAFYFLFSLRLIKFKSEQQKYKQKTSPESLKTRIKILVNPGLA